MARAALQLSQEHGVAVFPCIRQTKSPAVGRLRLDGLPWVKDVDSEETLAVLGGFHRATTAAEQVGAWWMVDPEYNIGVRLGAWLSLTMLEADDDAAGRLLESLAVDWPQTWTFRASRGVNRLFAGPRDLPERPVRNLWPETYGKGVEFKNGAGFFVAPPSVHPSGHVYEWVPGSAPWECALAPLPVVVADEVRRVDALRGVGRSAPQPRARAANALRASAAPRVALGALAAGVPLDFDAAEHPLFDPDRTRDALRYFDADDYETWRDVGLALKSTGDPSAREVWDWWSATSDKYDDATQGYQWAHFAPTSITVASIFYHAYAAGWRPSRRAA